MKVSINEIIDYYDNVLVEQVMEYIRQNYAEDITISQTAKEFAVDRRKLARVFERYIGISPNSYLIEFRMLKAKELLRTCNCTVKQIAECVGYPDSLYFSKAFKKQTGVSPIEYRERMKYGIYTWK
ncbi:AraC family transcriptional regulator [Sedimentibacter sp.]|uniref:AraC family transcriptional regulator n=1 Tax=Sedimentibacter sp. TaxID=1960295 RepID=UPI00289ECC75|nr:AraC family transcriptional regulator [Sedimentibacter sp.]